MSQYTTETEAFGETFTLTVDYQYSPGYPEFGPTYESGGEPGEPPSIEIFSVKCELNIYNKFTRATEYRPIPLTKELTEVIENWLQDTHFDTMAEETS